MTDGTSCGRGKRGAVTTTPCARNAANEATTTTPAASAVRATHLGSRLRAALTPSTTPATISSMPLPGAFGSRGNFDDRVVTDLARSPVRRVPLRLRFAGSR
jgi:hypothetical protein